MFRLKICGVTSRADARMCVEHGADALGLNFFPSSSRYVSPDAAEEIIREIPPPVVKVGLFVNAKAESVRDLARRLSLDLMQIHGDESPAMLAEFSGLAIMRALRLGKHNLSEALRYIDECRRLEVFPVAWLIDGWTPGQYGGAGRAAPAADVLALKAHLAGGRLVLAGGLNPDNVAAAIGQIQPKAVDVCSGVETSPGVKDGERTRLFLERAGAALSEVSK